MRLFLLRSKGNTVVGRPGAARLGQGLGLGSITQNKARIGQKHPVWRNRFQKLKIFAIQLRQGDKCEEVYDWEPGWISQATRMGRRELFPERMAPRPPAGTWGLGCKNIKCLNIQVGAGNNPTSESENKTKWTSTLSFSVTECHSVS